MGAVLAVQFVIFCIIIIKYTEDILAVFVYDQGGVPYEDIDQAKLSKHNYENSVRDDGENAKRKKKKKKNKKKKKRY